MPEEIVKEKFNDLNNKLFYKHYFKIEYIDDMMKSTDKNEIVVYTR